MALTRDGGVGQEGHSASLQPVLLLLLPAMPLPRLLPCRSPACLDPSSRKPPWAAPGRRLCFAAPGFAPLGPCHSGASVSWGGTHLACFCGLSPAQALSARWREALLPASVSCLPGGLCPSVMAPHCPRPCPFRGAFGLRGGALGMVPSVVSPHPQERASGSQPAQSPGRGWCGRPFPPWPVALSTWDLA